MSECQAAPHRHTVLVTDDDMAIREVVRDVLEAEGASVLVATDGREALTLFEQHHSAICLALLDLMLPGIPWLDVLHGMRRANDRVPVVVMSASPLHLADAGFDGTTLTLQKPFGLDELLEMVSHYCPSIGYAQP